MENTIKTELITNFMKENNLIKTTLCKLCKIGIDTLNKVLANKDNLRITALFKISRVLNIRISELF